MQTRRAALALLISTALIPGCSGVEPTVLGTVPPGSLPATLPGTLAAVDEPTPATFEIPALPPFGPAPEHNNLDWLADQAALVALDEVSNRQGELTLDLGGLPVLADRVAIGLAELELSFTRSDTADPTGNYGTVITVHGDLTAAVARGRVLASASTDGAAAVRRQTRTALTSRVDVELVVDVRDLATADAWFVATSADPSLLAAELADAPGNFIAWSNREAQQYVAEAVAFPAPSTGTGFGINTESRSTPPSIKELPYNSGMVVAHDLVGWATISATITLPEGDGLWPAIWLLADEVCDAPGRCLGYQTDAYYEIDLLELRSQIPDEAHFSLHWFDERIRSESTVASIDATTLDIEFERRPGLLIWRVDGTVVKVHADRVDSLASGAHSDGAMMLVVNTAVGGSFAGAREIGRTGEWLGEALVPETYPAPMSTDFVVAEMQIAAR